MIIDVSTFWGGVQDPQPLEIERYRARGRGLPFGSTNSQIVTLVARQTRFVMLLKVPSKDTEIVVTVLTKHTGALPNEL